MLRYIKLMTVIRKLIILFIITACAMKHANAQKQLVDIFIPGTALIKYSTGGTASGVIIGDSSYLYLVTARHCLIDLSKDGLRLVDTSLWIVYYNEDPFSSKADSIQVNLLSAFKQRDLIFDPENDIAILAFAKMQGFTSSGNPRFSYTSSATKLTPLAPGGMSDKLFLNFDQVDVGDDCLLIGYPSSLQLNSKDDYDFNRPLLRKGAISGKDKSKKTIIIDCPSYQGNSGGPVFSSPIYSSSNVGLIGIVSRSILHVENLESKYFKAIVSVNLYNSGYTVIIPIELARPLMKKRSSYP